jgi:hypothetical protein
MGVRIALMVLNLFAALWAWAGLHFSGVSRVISLLPIAVSLAVLASGWRGAGMVPARGSRVGKVVAIWSSIEGIALFVTANVLVKVHRPDLMLPLGAIVVGLHFFPLARGIPVRLYYATAAGLVIVGIGAVIVPAADRAMMAGMGAAVVLWATALAIVLRLPRASLPAV